MAQRARIVEKADFLAPMKQILPPPPLKQRSSCGNGLTPEKIATKDFLTDFDSTSFTK